MSWRGVVHGITRGGITTHVYSAVDRSCWEAGMKSGGGAEGRRVENAATYFQPFYRWSVGYPHHACSFIRPPIRWSALLGAYMPPCPEINVGHKKKIDEGREGG